MTARVGYPVTERKFGVEYEPKHIRHSRLLSDACFGRMAAIARITGMSERMLQYFMEPQSGKAGPTETASTICLAALEAGADPSLVLGYAGAVVDDVESRLRLLISSEEPLPLAEAASGVVKEVSDVAQVVIRCAMDGALDTDEMASIRRELREAQLALDQLEASASAKTEGAPAG